MSKNNQRRRGRLTFSSVLAVIGLTAVAWVLWPALTGAAAAIMSGGQTVYQVQPGPAVYQVQPPAALPDPQTGPALPPALPTAVYQPPAQPDPAQAQPAPGLTPAQAAAVQGQLVAYQTQIRQMAAALDHCQTAGRGLIDCSPLERQLARLMAGQRNLLAAAAQATGQGGQ